MNRGVAIIVEGDLRPARRPLKRTIRKGIYMDRIDGRDAGSCDTRLLSCLAVGLTVRREVEL